MECYFGSGLVTRDKTKPNFRRSTPNSRRNCCSHDFPFRLRSGRALWLYKGQGDNREAVLCWTSTLIDPISPNISPTTSRLPMDPKRPPHFPRKDREDWIRAACFPLCDPIVPYRMTPEQIQHEVNSASASDREQPRGASSWLRPPQTRAHPSYWSC